MILFCFGILFVLFCATLLVVLYFRLKQQIIDEQQRNETHTHSARPLHIAFCSDFCFPNLGGVEMHQFQLAQCLLEQGHTVIIITHAYGDRHGVRYMANGLKIYYLSHTTIYNGVTMCTFGLTLLPIVRRILVREQIDIIHAHSAFATMGHECLLFGATLNIRSCFTDHSLFGFNDASSILTNKVLKFSLSSVQHVVCVSHTSKENTCLRAVLPPEMVSVIPNAIDPDNFRPQPDARAPNRVTIVTVSRLAYRKGIDLLVQVIPVLCARYDNVHWIVGGDGPKRIDLDEMVEREQLHNRVELLGNVDHADVRDVLVRGDIFLNCSLTEAFCITIVEAASAGLSVVSTNVGGVPEVLPSDMIRLAQPNSADIVRHIESAVAALPEHDFVAQHARVRQMYDWRAVARRTEAVYHDIMKMPLPSRLERLRRYYACGAVFGKVLCCLYAANLIYVDLFDMWQPRSSIEKCPSSKALLGH